MPLSRQDLRQQLKRGQIASVYLLYGAEVALRDVAAETIAKLSFADDDLRDFNDMTISLSSSQGMAEAIAAAEQLPMMSKRRVVTVRGVNIAASSARDTVKEDIEPLLATFLLSPPDTCVLIMVADEFNRNRKVAKLIEKHATVVEFARLDDHELAEWASNRARELQVTLERRQAAAIVNRTGNDVSRVNNEVAKLGAAAMPDGVITDDLIASLVPNSREIDGFAFAGHLFAGRGSDALASIRQDLNDGTEPLQILGAISYTMRRLYLTKTMMQQGSDRQSIANAVKGRRSEHEALFGAARRSDAARLGHLIRRIAETDRAIKTSIGGSGSARAHIEILMSEIVMATNG